MTLPQSTKRGGSRSSLLKERARGGAGLGKARKAMGLAKSLPLGVSKLGVSAPSRCYLLIQLAENTPS